MDFFYVLFHVLQTHRGSHEKERWPLGRFYKAILFIMTPSEVFCNQLFETRSYSICLKKLY